MRHYATHGEALYSEFAKRKPAIEAWLKGEDENEDDDSEDSDSGDDSEAPVARKAVPAKRRKKLLDASTWQRDKGLMEVAQRAQKALGSAVFDDHNEFRSRFDAALKATPFKIFVHRSRNLRYAPDFIEKSRRRRCGK